MSGESRCSRCNGRPTCTVRCVCGRQVGEGCCWSHVDSKCFDCLQIYTPGVPRVRYGYRCAECNVRSERRENFGFKLVQRVYVSNNEQGGQLAQAKNVYLCQECWEEVFLEGGTVSSSSVASDSGSTRISSVQDMRRDWDNIALVARNQRRAINRSRSRDRAE